MSAYCTHFSEGSPRGNQPFNQESKHKNALLGTNVGRLKLHLAQQKQRETSVAVVKKKNFNPPVNTAVCISLKR